MAELFAAGLVAVVRAPDAESAQARAGRLLEAGAPIVEVAFTVPDAERAIAALCQAWPRAWVGAGTVMTARQAERAADAGAAFLFGPTFSAEVAGAARRLSVPYIPGAFTPTEVARCVEDGWSVVKLFPAAVLGVVGLTAIREPMPDVRCVPTGGIGVGDVAAWIRAGAVAVGLGGALTRAVDPTVAVRAALDAVRQGRAAA